MTSLDHARVAYAEACWWANLARTRRSILRADAILRQCGPELWRDAHAFGAAIFKTVEYAREVKAERALARLREDEPSNLVEANHHDERCN